METISILRDVINSLKGQRDSSTIESIWSKAIFPLIRTEDFVHNWKLSHDCNGLFYDERGERCTVIPCARLVSRYPKARKSALYPAIIFSKILYGRMMNELKTGFCLQPAIARRRIFADEYLTCFPEILGGSCHGVWPAFVSRSQIKR